MIKKTRKKKAISDKVVVAKPKKSHSIKSEYDGIQFLSNLEVFCYKALKEAKIDFKYEPTTYVLIPAFKSNVISYEVDKRSDSKLLVPRSQKLQSVKYTPDFVGKDWMIETKGAQTDVFNMRFKLFKKYLADNKLDYTLYMPKNHLQVEQAIKLILNKND